MKKLDDKKKRLRPKKKPHIIKGLSLQLPVKTINKDIISRIMNEELNIGLKNSDIG